LPASTGRGTAPHFDLVVGNGSGSGRYRDDDKVDISASSPGDGFYFIQWKLVKGDGSIKDMHSQDTVYLGGEEDATVAAVFAKVESWFPPGPEDSAQGILLPANPEGASSRMEHKVRVTTDQAGEDEISHKEVFDLVSVRFSWTQEEDASYFDAQQAGNSLSSGSNLPGDKFVEEGEGKFVFSMWYEGKQQQTAESPPNEVEAKFQLVANNKDIGEELTATLMPVQIKVSSANSPTGSDPKYTVTPEIPKKGNADNLFSVWPEEDFTVKVKLPESFQLPPNLIKWNVPGENIPDNAKEHTFNWTAVGTKRIEVQIGESKFEIWVDVPHVGDVGQAQAIATMPPWATAQIGAWAVFAQDYCNANYPVSPKRDAIRHSYWCALSASDGYVTQDQILYFATAHEFDDKWNDTPREQAFNSTMDLWNNFVGSTVNISHPTLPPTPNITQILQTLEQKYSAGELRIYDGSTSEGESEGIILKSNGTKIHPVN
jgi:hypothetical protein